MAPYLTLAQLDFLLAEPVAGAWPPDLAAHLARVKHLRTQASEPVERACEAVVFAEIDPRPGNRGRAAKDAEHQRKSERLICLAG